MRNARLGGATFMSVPMQSDLRVSLERTVLACKACCEHNSDASSTTPPHDCMGEYDGHAIMARRPTCSNERQRGGTKATTWGGRTRQGRDQRAGASTLLEHTAKRRVTARQQGLREDEERAADQERKGTRTAEWKAWWSEDTRFFCRL